MVSSSSNSGAIPRSGATRWHRAFGSHDVKPCSLSARLPPEYTDEQRSKVVQGPLEAARWSCESCSINIFTLRGVWASTSLQGPHEAARWSAVDKTPRQEHRGELLLRSEPGFCTGAGELPARHGKATGAHELSVRRGKASWPAWCFLSFQLLGVNPASGVSGVLRASGSSCKSYSRRHARLYPVILAAIWILDQ